MGTRTRSSHLWFLLCFAGFLSLSLLPSGGSIYTSVFFILVMDVLKDKAVVVWKNLRESCFPGIVVSDLLVEIDSLRQGERTVEEYSEEFGVLWKELETLRPLAVCTCGAKCFCSDALREERKNRRELKLVSFLKGLNDGSRIMLENRLLSLNKDCDSVVEEAVQMEMVCADQQSQGVKQNQSQPPSTLEQAIVPRTKLLQEVREVQKLNRSIHPHPLILKPSGAPYICSGCLELGLGPSYCCETDNCNYILHEDCANVVANNSLVFHRFFKESNFMFYQKLDDWCERICDACGNDVRGFSYHCHTTGKDLHPCCLKLKDSVSDKGGHVTFKLCETVPRKCKKCKGKKVENNIEGWSYVSSDGDYCFHVSCVKRLILEKWKEGYFSEDESSFQKYDPETQIPLTGKEMVKAGRRSSKGSVKTKVFTKIATVALELIVSVIFGNPAPLILTALGAISGN